MSRKHRFPNPNSTSNVVALKPRQETKPRPALAISPVAWGCASGYGRVAMSLAKALIDLGCEISIARTPIVTGDAPALPVSELSADTVLHIGDPPTWVPSDNQRNVGLTWWGASKMPDAWRPALFGMDQIIVPSEWCGQSTALPKPNQTLSIVPLGVGSQFTPTARKRGPKLKFLAFDTHADSMRAGMDIAMRAFGTAFPGRSDVRLDIWTTQPAAVSGTDIRIQLRGGVGPDRELLALYHEYDALIFASRGEGFGLVPLEAIASGMPVLHSGQTGMAGIADLGQLIGSRQMLAPSAVQEGAHWYEPIVDILAARLRQFDTQYDAWQNKALGDAQIVSERFTWRASALALLNAMEGNDAVSQSGELHQPRAV